MYVAFNALSHSRLQRQLQGERSIQNSFEGSKGIPREDAFGKKSEFKIMKKELPDLHKQAFIFKNTKRFQHDGGRAWIKDSQLNEARKGHNGGLKTITRKKSLE